MSLAIRWGDDSAQNGGMIFLDAVTAYTKNNKGKVTKHPIALGSNVTDHFIKENDTIRISAVISGADISTNTYLIQDLNGNSPYNSFEPPTAVSVNSTDQSVLKKFIPDSIGQFLSDSTPEVVMDSAREDLLEQIRSALEALNSGVIFNEKTGQFDPNIQLVQLFEYDGTLLRKIINNLVITDITFKEDANTGYALYFDMVFEQVTFAFLRKTVIPKDVVDSLKKKAAPKASKGKADSTPDAGAAPKDIDPLRQARDN
jgi:hypothetical protein